MKSLHAAAVLKATGGGSITEGIGIGRVTANIEAPIDRALHIEDPDGALHLPAAARGGLFISSTSGINVAAAVRVAREEPDRAHRW